MEPITMTLGFLKNIGQAETNRNNQLAQNMQTPIQMVPAQIPTINSVFGR